MNFNYNIVFVLFIIFFVLFFKLTLLHFRRWIINKNIEGFSLSGNTFVPWPKDLVHRFKVYQATVGENNYQYNIQYFKPDETRDICLISYNNFEIEKILPVFSIVL